MVGVADVEQNAEKIAAALKATNLDDVGMSGYRAGCPIHKRAASVEFDADDHGVWMRVCTRGCHPVEMLDAVGLDADELDVRRYRPPSLRAGVIDAEQAEEARRVQAIREGRGGRFGATVEAIYRGLVRDLEGQGFRQHRRDRWPCPNCGDKRHGGMWMRPPADGRLHFKPFCGCTKEQVLEALGWTWADLYPPGDPDDVFGYGHSGVTRDAGVTETVTDVSAAQMPYRDGRDGCDAYDRDAAVTQHRQTRWTGTELLAADFPDPKWAVNGLISEGLTLVCGPPKAGKSWLGLGLSVAVATGGKAFGKIDVRQGDVLYLALEDTGRRLRTRLEKVTADLDPDELGRLTIETRSPRMPAGGGELRAWLDDHPDARLVVIDVFAKMRSRTPQSVQQYDADYAAASEIKAIADEYGVAIVVVHHTRKMEAQDFLDTVSGSQGIAGAADAVLVMKRPRGEADGVLHVTGRDVDEAEYGLEFDKDTGAWKLLDEPVFELTMSDTRRGIYRYVEEHPSVRPGRIAEALNLKADTVRQQLRRMRDSGEVRSTPGGYYSVTPPPGMPVTPVTPVTVGDVTCENSRDTLRDTGVTRHALTDRKQLCSQCGKFRHLNPNTRRCADCETETAA